MRKRPRSAQQALAARRLWTKRSYSVYSNMRARLKKLGREIPFTCDKFRAWAVRDLHKPCRFCRAEVTEKSFSADHETPISRGGGCGLDCMAVICKSCNTAKGEMTGEEFHRFMEFLATLPECARMDVYGRLKAGAAVKRLKFLGRKQP